MSKARRSLPAVLLACGLAAVAPPAAQAQAQQPVAPAADAEEIIVTLRANGIRRGEFQVLRTPQGEFWMKAADLARLKLAPAPAAARSYGGEAYQALPGLGASSIVFDEAELTLSLDFPPERFQPTAIDLSNLPAEPLRITAAQSSAILNYRGALRQPSAQGPLQLLMATELNVRVGEAVLRQEAKVETGRAFPAFARGMSQLIWDNRLDGRRVIVGDQLTMGGPYATSITAAGVSVSRVFDITPDVLRQPTAAMSVSATTPSEVEVSVDGSPVYRATVPPGPVNLQNLFYLSGARTVRVTVTDPTGRRQVYEQPFLFTDSVLARGLHEYSYFAGRRSTLGPDDRWRYGEAVAQGYHRYGLTDHVTLEGSAEGTEAFASGSGGLSLRFDRLGLVSLALLASDDRVRRQRAQGWAARYTYLGIWGAFSVGRRQFAPGFRSLETLPLSASLLSETRVGISTRLFEAGNVSLDWNRVQDTLQTRAGLAVRLSTYLNRRTLVSGEYSRTRTAGASDWAFNLYLRYELDDQRWVGSTLRASPGTHTLDLETGKQLDQGEGYGYRLGSSTGRVAGEAQGFVYGNAAWNLKNVALDVNASKQVSGGDALFLEAGVSGSVVAIDGFVGTTRQVPDSFALARLGVPHPGVEVSLNSQPQGKTDARGELLIPNVGAFGRQDVSLDDKQLPIQYSVATRRVTIAPPFRSGTVVEFGGRQLRAATGVAAVAEAGGRKPIASRRWTMSNGGQSLRIETATAGEFYLEDAPPGRYTGSVELDGRRYSCRMEIPESTEIVIELREGIRCE